MNKYTPEYKSVRLVCADQPTVDKLLEVLDKKGGFEWAAGQAISHFNPTGPVSHINIHSSSSSSINLVTWEFYKSPPEADDNEDGVLNLYIKKVLL